MKRLILYLLVFCPVINSVKAQTTIYLDDQLSQVSDVTKASSKIILKKYTEDTALWAVSQYSLNDKLLAQGVYKDREMTIPNGDFKYYYLHDTTYYLKRSGGFFNGAKFGEWIEYYPNGRKMTVENYRNNKLNGPYERYNLNDTVPAVKGLYNKGIRDGVWLMSQGERLVYKDGVIIEKTGQKDPEEADRIRKERQGFKDAQQSAEFEAYVQQSFKFYFSGLPPSNGIRTLVVEFIVDEQGKLSFENVSTNLNDNIIKRIVKIIAQAPRWKPATSNGKPVSENIHYTITELKNPVGYSRN